MFELIENREQLSNCLVKLRRAHRDLRPARDGTPIKYPCLVDLMTEWYIPTPHAPTQIQGLKYERAVMAICYRPVAKKIIYPQKSLPLHSFYGFDIIPNQQCLKRYVDSRTCRENIDKQAQYASTASFYDEASKIEKLFPCLVTSRRIGVRDDRGESLIVRVWKFFLIDMAMAKSLVYVKKNGAIKVGAGKISELVLSYDRSLGTGPSLPSPAALGVEVRPDNPIGPEGWRTLTGRTRIEGSPVHSAISPMTFRSASRPPVSIDAEEPLDHHSRLTRSVFSDSVDEIANEDTSEGEDEDIRF